MRLKLQINQICFQKNNPTTEMDPFHEDISGKVPNHEANNYVFSRVMLLDLYLMFNIRFIRESDNYLE